MGNFDGMIEDKDKDITNFSETDFHFLNNIIYINKNIKFILHPSQYSNNFTVVNDILDLNKDKININPKSIVKLDPATGAHRGTIMVDPNDDNLKLNHNSDFIEDYNSSLWVNIGPGLERNSQYQIKIALGCQGVRLINNKLCLNVSPLINNTSGSITMDSNKERLELNYSNDSKNHINANYVKSIIDKNYIKDSIINESWYRDNNIFTGEELLKKYSFCWINLNALSMVIKNANKSNNVTMISKIGNNRHKDIDYFECFNNIAFNFRHYSGLLIKNIVFDNYMQFNNTNQYISYTEHYPKIPSSRSHIVYLFNFVFQVEKKSINSTLWESNNGKSYIKILFNHSGIIYKLDENSSEFIINTSSLLDKKSIL